MLVIVGLLMGALYAGYEAVSASSDAETAEHTLRSVITAQQLRYASRGAFSDDPGDLSGLEPSWTYVDGSTAAASFQHVSVAKGRHDDIDAVALATTSGRRCLGVVVYDPSLRGTATSRWDPSEAPCTANSAFTEAGVDPW